MELKVFTLPTCSGCPVAKKIVFEIAKKYGIACKVIDMATEEGLREGLGYQITSAPSIAIDEEVIVRGHLISQKRFEEEVRKRLEKWKTRVSTE